MKIKRKFLVDAALVLEEITRRGCSCTYVRRGYLSTSMPIAYVQTQQANSDGADVHAFIYVVSDQTRADASIKTIAVQTMLDLCPVQIRKAWYVMPNNWVIGVFNEPLAGLVLASRMMECDEQFERPVWLREEVTDDDRYQNINLARAGKIPEPRVFVPVQAPVEGL